MSQCDHILGYAECQITRKDTGQVLATYTQEIKAKQAAWKGDGTVTRFWIGPHFKFCPDCGVSLGELVFGGRLNESGAHNGYPEHLDANDNEQRHSETAQTPLEYLIANPTHTVLSIHESDSKRHATFKEAIKHMAWSTGFKIREHSCIITTPEGGTLHYMHVSSAHDNKLMGYECHKAFPEGAYPDLERLPK